MHALYNEGVSCYMTTSESVYYSGLIFAMVGELLYQILI